MVCQFQCRERPLVARCNELAVFTVPSLLSAELGPTPNFLEEDRWPTYRARAVVGPWASRGFQRFFAIDRDWPASPRDTFAISFPAPSVQ
jgi:hypothetical protein